MTEEKTNVKVQTPDTPEVLKRLNRILTHCGAPTTDGALTFGSMLAPEFVSADTEKGVFVMSYKRKDWERNNRGELHGGIILSMFDHSMGAVAVSASPTGDAMTVDMQASFIRPFTADEYYIEVQLMSSGKTLSRLRSVARDGEGRLLATSNGTYAVFDPSKRK